MHGIVKTRKPDKTWCPECGCDLRVLYRRLKASEANPAAWADTLLEAVKCPTCRSMYFHEVRQITGICETCGQLMKHHKTCKDCGILIGKGHEYERQDIGRCAACAAFKRTKRKYFAVVEDVN